MRNRNHVLFVPSSVVVVVNGEIVFKKRKNRGREECELISGYCCFVGRWTDDDGRTKEQSKMAKWRDSFPSKKYCKGSSSTRLSRDTCQFEDGWNVDALLLNRN